MTQLENYTLWLVQNRRTNLKLELLHYILDNPNATHYPIPQAKVFDEKPKQKRRSPLPYSLTPTDDFTETRPGKKEETSF